MHDLEVEAVARALGKCSEDELSDWFKVARVAIAAYEGSRSGSVEVDQRLTPEQARAAADALDECSDEGHLAHPDARAARRTLRALAGSVGEPDA